MSALSEHHQKLDQFGEGKCSVPMWGGGCPSGFCDKPAYGVRPVGQEYWSYGAGQMMRIDGRYPGFVPALACPIHGGPKVRVFMDGNAYCAVASDFVNLQESPAGFDDSATEAIVGLEKEMMKQRRVA